MHRQVRLQARLRRPVAGIVAVIVPVDEFNAITSALSVDRYSSGDDGTCVAVDRGSDFVVSWANYPSGGYIHVNQLN